MGCGTHHRWVEYFYSFQRLSVGLFLVHPKFIIRIPTAKNPHLRSKLIRRYCHADTFLKYPVVENT